MTTLAGLKSLAKQMVAEGAPTAMIAELAGVSVGTVRRWRREWGLVGKTGRARTEPPHGTELSYQHGCRCDDCRDTHTAFSRARRRERYRLTAANGLPPGIAHGTGGYGNWGCRCATCVEAHSVQCAVNYSRRNGVPATDTTRYYNQTGANRG